jgi:glycosyltransferase involved in cell wall biosynthesis
MRRVAIVCPNVVEADAVSNDALGMYRVLSQRYEVALFAVHCTVADPEVRPLDKARRFLRGRKDVMIYHHSVGSDPGMELLHRARCRKVIKYHNVTPPAFFEGLSESFVAGCRSGRRQMEGMARAGFDLYLSDSAYNMEEMIEEGANRRRSGVLPPFHHIDRLEDVEADLGVLDTYRDGTTNVLAVGRLAPNKGHPALIDAFAVYHHEYNADSRLLVVGKAHDLLAPYTDALRAQVEELGLTGAVVFTGEVSDEALKSYYLLADVFLLTSEHEGFCVPLVEAMSMKVPVVARGAAAVPGTVGKAGLVWDDADPGLLAESVHCLAADEDTRAHLGFLGWRRYREQYTTGRIEEAFWNYLGGVL